MLLNSLYLKSHLDLMTNLEHQKQPFPKKKKKKKKKAIERKH